MTPIASGAEKQDLSARVLFVYRVCGLGGVETSVVNRLKALQGTGFEGHALFGEYYGSQGESLAKSLGASVGLSRQDTIALLRDGFRAIVVIDHPDFMDVVGEAAPRCPVLLETHASFTPALPRLYKHFGHPQVSTIIAPSGFNKRMIEEHTETSKNVVVIPNAVDDDVFRPLGDDPLITELGGVQGGPVVIWIGRLEDEKNPAEFVSIASHLIEKNPDVRFVIVGDCYSDPEYANYRRRLSDGMSGELESRFSFVRGIRYDGMPQLYNLAAGTGGCLVSTSRFESVPMTFIEAMACRCPVVSTDVGGVRELVTEGETGYLYEQGRIEDACRLVRLLIDRGRRPSREAITANAAALVARRHSLEAVGALYERLFDSMKVGAAKGGSPRASETAAVDAEGEGTTIPGLVSTIIPVYNRSALLREAVQSVLDQTYQNVEVIIVDDGSTDDTAAVCDELARDHSAVQVLHIPHVGLPGLVREAGRRAARGEYLQYLDSDDLVAPTKFATMVAALAANPDCDVAYCHTRRSRLGEAPSDDLVESTLVSFPRMLPACVSQRLWLTPTPLYRRSLCDAVGAWSDLELWEDIEYDMRVAARSTGLCHCKELLVEVRDHDTGRVSSRDFYSEPGRMRELARAVQMIYAAIRRCGLDRDEEHLRWFLEDVRVIHRRSLELGLDDAAAECARVVTAATGLDESECMEEISVGARIQPRVAVLRVRPGASVFCPVVVRNESTISFRGGDFAFGLSYHVMSLDRAMLRFDNQNVVFEPPLRPGEERLTGVWIKAPDVPGLYLAELDISWGPATWLKSLGNPTGTVKLLVTDFIKEGQWRLQLTGDNEATVTLPGGHRESVQLDIQRATTDVHWHIQLNQDALSVRAQQPYVLRFRARSEKCREVGVGVSMAHPPWQGLGLYRRVELSPDWEEFAIEFVGEEDDHDARVHFDVGGCDAGVELRDVRLTALNRGIDVEPPALSYVARFQMDFGVPALSDWWGTDRGLAIHRYYLEKFLAEFAPDIRGRCLEFQDPQYTPRFGGSRVTHLDILHMDESNPRATLVADLTKPNDLPGEAFDCVVCTHVLHTIFEAEKAVRGIHRILKPGGVLLAAVPQISMYGPDYGELWRFTPEGLRVLLSRVFGEDNVDWRAYGNSLTAAGEIRGLASHEFTKAELDQHDVRFAVEVCARAVKGSEPGSPP